MKKVVSVILAVIMCVIMLPVAVFAENTSGVLETEIMLYGHFTKMVNL